MKWLKDWLMDDQTPGRVQFLLIIIVSLVVLHACDGGFS